MKSLGFYSQILSLKGLIDKQKKGYLFEQILREILPWSFRPPISVSTRTEQIDGFFEWRSWHFLMEAKAKEGVITAGSHDWEDFALKLRKRKGQCVGLFCSLYDVNEEVVREAEQLNKEGIITIVIAGKAWERLDSVQIPLSEFLMYMIFHAKATHIATPKSYEDVGKWIYDKDLAEEKAIPLCEKVSSTFLRRHRLARHKLIYVEREIDNEISQYANSVRPSKLRDLSKSHVHGKTSYKVKRVIPKQILIVRDLSGSGKTTLSVQIADERKLYLGMARAALQQNSDEIFDHLDVLGGSKGIQELIAMNRPIVYVVDSLDEATNTPHKAKEISSIVRGLKQLNEIAISRGFLCFPILVVFTIREDFWRDWESLFEGTSSVNLLKRFSYFTPEQTRLALKRYSKAYSYNLSGSLDKNAMEVLSQPFNMQIYSEANEYRGTISAKNILNEDVLAIYFERKKEDLLKRTIPNFTPTALMSILANVSKEMALQSENGISHKVFCDKILEIDPSFEMYTDQIIRSIISEQILVRDSEDAYRYRFRHMRFIEYLVAYYIVMKLSLTMKPSVLESSIKKFVRGDFLTLYYVHEFIRAICKSNFPNIYGMLIDFYSQSAEYMKRLLRMRRADIAYGGQTTSIDLDTICKAVASGNSNVSWEGFFVVAAKVNFRNIEEVITGFLVAWEKNSDRHDRWKLLEKVSSHQLLLESDVFNKVLSSDREKDWYVFLDGLIAQDQSIEFGDIWKEAGGEQLTSSIGNKEGYEWKRVEKIIRALLKGEIYEKGELLQEPEPSKIPDQKKHSLVNGLKFRMWGSK